MPVCKRCGNSHFNFQGCTTKPTKSKPVDIAYRKDEPEGFHISKRWGTDPVIPIIYQLPGRQRTGSLVGPDGETYTPAPLSQGDSNGS